jgi:hypothetical protein
MRNAERKPSTKSQAPNPKQIPILNIQKSKTDISGGFDHWIFSLYGIWDLVLGISDSAIPLPSPHPFVIIK